ncbi:MAG: hypothetical protein J6Y02_10765 [Pseudobutyrivibrio sp.]|nr:hypothetical protein [Pseudobutyrivibrio sp.]
MGEIAKTTTLLDASSSQTVQDESNQVFVHNIVGSGMRRSDIMSSYVDNFKINSLTGVFGAPYQFLPSVDTRLDVDGHMSGDYNNSSNRLSRFGRKYAEKIVQRMPIMYLSPGEPRFMPQVTKPETRSNFISTLITLFSETAMGNGIAKAGSALEALTKQYQGKYYYIDLAYNEYYKYVTPMCRTGAFMLGIQNRKYYGTDLREFPWYLNTSDSSEITSTGSYDYDNEKATLGNFGVGSNTIVPKDISSFFKSLGSSNWSYYRRAVPFYIESDSQITDNFTNDTTESQLAGMANGLSDQARELQFILGATSSEIGWQYDEMKDSTQEFINKIQDKLQSGGHNIFSNIVETLSTVGMGGRLIFPEIWSDSKFSKSYSISMKFATPDKDPFSWYLNIYVPLCHLLAFVLPRQYGKHGYSAPFLVRAYYKGFFNVDMGIVTNLTFNKGKECGWTRDGLPTIVEVQMEIKDLYQEMSMTSNEQVKYNLMSNTAELDYIANMCGVNINAPDLERFIEMYYNNNFENKISDYIAMDIWGGLQDAVQNFGFNTWNKLIGRI